MTFEPEEYRHDLPSSDRRRATYTVSVETFDRLRRGAIAKGTSANEQCSRAMEAQLQGWIAEEIVCVPPFGAPTIVKPAGVPFPSRRGNGHQGGFNKTHDRGTGDGELLKTTIRVDPNLLEAWIDAVWHQHDTYPYLSFAFEAALVAHLESIGI